MRIAMLGLGIVAYCGALLAIESHDVLCIARGAHRLEYLLVPLVLGLVGPLVAMAGTNLARAQGAAKAISTTTRPMKAKQARKTAVDVTDLVKAMA